MDEQTPALEDRYFDLTGLSAYSGLSPRTLRRYMTDPVHPIPHHHIRGPGKDRGRLLFSRRAFDAWVAAFPPHRAAAPVAVAAAAGGRNHEMEWRRKLGIK